MSFDKLLSTIGEMAKATPAPASTVESGKQGAAANNTADPNDPDSQTSADNGGGTGAAGGGNSQTNEGKSMTKSFIIKLEDGTDVEAVDGTELIKSLTEKLDATGIELAKEKEVTATLETNVMKSFDAAVLLIAKQTEAIKSQEQLIKSLTAKVDEISKEGRGARSVQNTMVTNATMAKSVNGSNQEPTTGEILAKSLSAAKAGRITGLDATTIETYVNLGRPVPEHLLAAISN